MRSRKEDASVKERELALQSLDLAYHKYKEIIRNLGEGLKASFLFSARRSATYSLWSAFSSQFYNDLAAILSQFRDSCKEWVNLRRSEIRYISVCCLLVGSYLAGRTSEKTFSAALSLNSR